jgi:hypothetical protein
MKASELRIGNYIHDVNHPERECRIFRLTSGSNYNIAYSYGKCYEDGYSYEKTDALQGIPLTEDCLLKFGFEKINHRIEGIIYQKEWLILSETFMTNWRGGRVGRMESVHQLQNLYFALTGKELEMK